MSASRIDGCRRQTSLFRGPLKERPSRSLALSLIKEEIELAGGRVVIHLLVPALLI